MSLFNVRLGPEDKRLADELREEGIPISRIVREAIRSEHARRVSRRTGGRKPSELLARLFQRFPDPPGTPTHGVDTTDRRAVQRFIAARLRGSRR